MAQTDFAEFESKTSGDRTVMHILYGLHTVAWLSMGTLAVIALIVNYIKRADEHDAVYVSHHNYMIATFWWTVLWMVLSGLLALVMMLTILLIPLVWVPFSIVGLWYLYRCIRGWLRFTEGKPPF
jgi:uncharacterized membrane protein